MKKTVAQLPLVRILGRHNCTEQALTLFYTASGIECLFTGSELWLELEADYGNLEPWISVELNGAWLSRFPVAKGKSEVCLVRGMSSGVPKRIRVLKDVQAMHDDPQHMLKILSLRWEGGDFQPLPEPALRLEFIGDSITSGEGAIGAKEEIDWLPMFFSAMNNYAKMTADALNAQLSIVSQSGWGLLSAWNNEPTCRLLDYYDKVCGLTQGEGNLASGSGADWDFAKYPQDAVIINLGTNDGGAMNNPAWENPETGETYQQLDTPEHRAELEQTAVDALKMLRSHNPQALLVWAYGMLGDVLEPVLKGAVERFRAETGDERAFYISLPNATDETIGARWHPGVKCHRQAAEVVTAFLREKLLPDQQ